MTKASKNAIPLFKEAEIILTKVFYKKEPAEFDWKFLLIKSRFQIIIYVTKNLENSPSKIGPTKSGQIPLEISP